MGCTNSKVCASIQNSSCLRKFSKVVSNTDSGKRKGIKEVYNLFVIVDFLTLKELVKVSRVSR